MHKEEQGPQALLLILFVLKKLNNLIDKFRMPCIEFNKPLCHIENMAPKSVVPHPLP